MISDFLSINAKSSSNRAYSAHPSGSKGVSDKSNSRTATTYKELANYRHVLRAPVSRAEQTPNHSSQTSSSTTRKTEQGRSSTRGSSDFNSKHPLSRPISSNYANTSPPGSNSIQNTVKQTKTKSTISERKSSGDSFDGKMRSFRSKTTDNKASRNAPTSFTSTTTPDKKLPLQSTSRRVSNPSRTPKKLASPSKYALLGSDSEADLPKSGTEEEPSSSTAMSRLESRLAEAIDFDADDSVSLHSRVAMMVAEVELYEAEKARQRPSVTASTETTQQDEEDDSQWSWEWTETEEEVTASDDSECQECVSPVSPHITHHKFDVDQLTQSEITTEKTDHNDTHNIPIPTVTQTQSEPSNIVHQVQDPHPVALHLGWIVLDKKKPLEIVQLKCLRPLSSFLPDWVLKMETQLSDHG
ncbi:hypothetical protein BLNAU_15111 [Blattamonas nauphoetae]|uniref:Uncharacterized protein n=1 Tax=Blattamonas nauphoetae TaxID=2049346 RepID=A0ABQ9XF86_9EUKA|nr:hypothetical protein BLNAU_15111 [Blattamonas nauphoetae]